MAGVSYAAATRANPVAPELRSQIERGYLRYWEARRLAYQNLDPTPLRQTILEPALESDSDLLQQQRQKNQGFTIQVEHNDRIGIKDANTAYVYDTFADSSFYFNFDTKAQIPPGQTKVQRETYELVKVDGLWKVDVGALNK